MSTLSDLSLHHIGYATTEIEARAEIFVTRFGYLRASPVIHDPLQSAFVQFLQLPAEPTYIELVAPDGPTSKLVAAARSGGLHHLCYIARSLEDAIAHLEMNRMKLISDPKPAVAFAGRRICWLLGNDRLPIELVERRDDTDRCAPGL